jgi:hypothetical protein
VTTANRIAAKCAALAEFLIAKNRSYGNSALHPVNIFSRGDPVASLCARIDDKLARVRNAPGAFGEDVVQDLLGYLVLLQLALEDQAAAAETDDDLPAQKESGRQGGLLPTARGAGT